jgi:hypothetical protein
MEKPGVGAQSPALPLMENPGRWRASALSAPIRFPDKNCLDAVFIWRLRPKCNFALPAAFVWHFGYELSGRAFQFQLKN